MSVLSRLESAQRVDVTFRDVVRNEAESLMGVVTSAVTMELRRLGRSRPGLSEWAYAALAIISEFVPVASASLSVDIDGVPPVWMGFGTLVDARAQPGGWLAAPAVTRASVSRPLMADGEVVGQAALIAGSSALSESVLVEVLAVLESELPAVLVEEYRLRASASEIVTQRARSVGSLDDVVRLEELAQALVLLPSTIGISVVASSVLSIEPVRLKVGSLATSCIVVERLVVGRGVLEIAAHLIDDQSNSDASTVHADRATLEAAVAAGLREALALVEAAVSAGEQLRDQVVAHDGGGPSQVRLVIDHALARPSAHSPSVLVTLVALDEASSLGPNASALVDRLLTTLAATRPASCIGRIGDHVVVLSTAMDELEAQVLAGDLAVMANAAIKPRGLSPRAHRVKLGLAVSPVHGDDPDTLLAYALAQLAPDA
jgi:hypothetical protein